MGTTNNTNKNKTKTPGFDFLGSVETTRQIHPRSQAPAADRRAIKSACTRMMKKKGLTQRDAMLLLYMAAKMYRDSRANENPTYTKTCAAWFNGDCFEAYTEKKQQAAAPAPSLGTDALDEMRKRRAAKLGK